MGSFGLLALRAIIWVMLPVLGPGLVFFLCSRGVVAHIDIPMVGSPLRPASFRRIR